MKRNNNDSERAWVDPDDAREWSEDVFERAEARDGEKVLQPASGTLTKRGRPKSLNPKRQVTLRLDGDLIDALRRSGPGWQVRVNEILKKAVSLG